jgi:hypothetical protein
MSASEVSPPPLWRPMLAATFAPGLALGLWAALEGRNFAGLLFGLTFVSAISACHVLVIGIPYAFWLHRSGRFRAWTMALGGFVAGAIPLGLLLGRSAEPAVFFGSMGALAALAFYVTSKALTRGRQPGGRPNASK